MNNIKIAAELIKIAKFLISEQGQLQSSNLRNTYTKWVSTASAEEVSVVDGIYKVCEDNYKKGGDTCVEAMTPEEVIAHYKRSISTKLKPLSLRQIKEYFFFSREDFLR